MTHNRENSPDNSTLSSPPEGNLSEEARTELVNLSEAVHALRKDVALLLRREARKGLDPLLSREEAADVLSISTRTLDDMTAAEELQPVRIRGRVLYHPKALEAYVRRAAGEGGQ